MLTVTDSGIESALAALAKLEKVHAILSHVTSSLLCDTRLMMLSSE